MPLSLLIDSPGLFFAWIVAVIFGITIHEYSHVLAAYLQGDPTGKDHGRLTLNPLVHIDPLGLIALVIARFGWGRPAPFNPTYFKRPRLGTFFVAIAGPLSNLAAIIVFGLAYRFLLPALNIPSTNLLVGFFEFLIVVNLVLMLFNLIPIPPLDGSRVLLTLIPKQYAGFAESLERYGPFLLIGLIIFGQPLLIRLFNATEPLLIKLLGG